MAVRADAAAAETRADRRNARLYLVGLAASLIGSSAMSLVAGVWVKSLTGSSAMAGLVSACAYAPSLFGPVGGMIADRVPRRRLLFRLNLASAVLMLPLLAVRSPAQIWIVFCVMTWYGVELVLSGPAEDALFAEMLPLGLRQRVNGWRLGLQETGRLVAPLFGAALFTLASLVSSRLLRHLGEGWLAVLGMIDFAVGSALRATGVLACAVLGTVVLGFALPWAFLAVVNLAQRLTPLFLQGRVPAAVTLAMFGPQAPTQALGSLAIRCATYRQLLSAGAALALACAAYLLWATSGRRSKPDRPTCRPASAEG